MKVKASESSNNNALAAVAGQECAVQQDAVQQEAVPAHYAMHDLGAVTEMTGLYADGSNRDGGHEHGHNYTYL